MNTILVFNVGSSSVKYAVFQQGECVLKENFERIKTQKDRNKIVRKIALTLAQNRLKPTQIGHRIVHGANLTHTTKITPDVRLQLTQIADLAILHTIAELQVVDFCEALFNVAQYAVFDTAFHHTIPQKNHMYAIPKIFYEHGIRKYGFHGISHEFVTSGLKGNVISCHLGSGCSITAIQNGKSIQTSMGFTPLDGLMMGTRCGSIDAGVIPHLVKHEHMTLTQINQMLNEESGLLAIGGSNDLRDLLSAKNKNAKLAVAMYVQRIIETIGSYIAVLGGVDTIVFTAGTGEQSPIIREKICDAFVYIGLKIDVRRNKNASAVQTIISTDKSKVKVLVIPTNEELAIAQKIAEQIK